MKLDTIKQDHNLEFSLDSTAFPVIDRPDLKILYKQSSTGFRYTAIQQVSREQDPDYVVLFEGRADRTGVTSLSGNCEATLETYLDILGMLKRLRKTYCK